LRRLTLLASYVGLLLCVGAATTGMYWGINYKKGDFQWLLGMNAEDWRQIHLKIAVACVFVSLVAHVLAIRFAHKSAKS
jgi:hypothetical protein